MDVAPAKIIFVVIFSFEVHALCIHVLYARPITQCYRKRIAWKVFSCHYMENSRMESVRPYN